MNSGGSPSGDSAPPTLPTSRMKNTTACARWRRPSLAVSSGRISSIDAPVVPMTLASAAPSASSAVLTRRRAGERAAQADAAGDREQREQHGDERHVLEHASRARRCAPPRAAPNVERERHEERERPRRRELAVVRVPELRRERAARRRSKAASPANGSPHASDSVRAVERRKHVRRGRRGDHGRAGRERPGDAGRAPRGGRREPSGEAIANAESDAGRAGPPARYNFPLISLRP